MADWLRGVVADKVLHKVLGKFVSGIDKDALDLDLGMGDIALHSLALNLETFEALDLPFHVAGGTLGQVRVKVPWRNITNEPTKIVIDRVYLLLSPKDASPVSADAREAAAAAAKREFLEGWEAQQERKSEQKQGFGAYVGEQVEKLVRSILQKLQIRALDPSDRHGARRRRQRAP
jgi:vacuolar protein sorting-associated protein 13A/C